MTQDEISKLSDDQLVRMYHQASDLVSAKNTSQMGVKILNGDF